jgi:hypothetical protein
MTDTLKAKDSPGGPYRVFYINTPYVLVMGDETVREVNEVTETDNAVREEDLFVVPLNQWSDGILHCGPTHTSPATTKTVTTTRVRVTTLTFDWLGQKRAVEDRKVLWAKARKLVKKELWIPPESVDTLEELRKPLEDGEFAIVDANVMTPVDMIYAIPPEPNKP